MGEKGSDKLDPKIIKKTQDTLGKIIKKPPFTEKLLAKPPFRFLHDVITSVIRSTGFMKGLYAEPEMNSENVKEKDSKVAFLQKAIDMVSLVLGKALAARPTKIVAGHEPERTNEFLVELAAAINKKVKNDEYVRRVLKSDGKSSSSKKERDSSASDKPKKEKKEGDKEEEKKHRSKEDREKSKDRDASRDRGDKEKSREKSRSRKEREDKEDGGSKEHRDKDRHRDKERDRDKDKERDKDSHKEKDRERRKPPDSAPVKEPSKSRTPAGKKAIKTAHPDVRVKPRQVQDVPSPHKSKRREDKERQEDGDKKNKDSKENKEDEEAPLRPARPSSAKGSRRRQGQEEHKEKEGRSRERSGMTNGTLGEDDLPPQVAAARKMQRPSSARPAPPRVKKEEGQNEPLIMGSGNVPNVIVDQKDDSDDDDDAFIAKDEEEPPPLDMAPPRQQPDAEEDGEHGGLVKKILETKKELEGGSQQQKPGKKTEIERSHVNDATRRKEREIIQKEIDKLRSSIQTLTRSVNPLGKILDFLQEDLDSMQKELEVWKKENKENAVALQREQSITESSIEPLKAHLQELEAANNDQLDLIAAVKHNILKNDDKIEKMLSTVTKS